MPRRSNVFPCIAASARYRGSGSTEPKGLTVSRKAAFLRRLAKQICSNLVSALSTLNHRTPPLSSKTPTLSALSRGRGGHCAFANFTDLLTIDRYNSSCFPRRIALFRDNANCVFIGKILPIETKKRTFTSHNKTFAT